MSEKLYKHTYGSVYLKSPIHKTNIISVYADTMGSGIAFKPIEKRIKSILPSYANTHSNAYNGCLMASLIKMSKNAIMQYYKANQKDYELLFCGSGMTGSINLLIHLLDITKNTIIFVSIMEHHSNLLPWRESKGKVVVLPVDEFNNIVMDDFDKVMKSSKKYDKVICSFQAGSNVTGKIQNIQFISNHVKSYKNTILIWDLAAYSPYNDGLHMDMYKIDAIYVSPHKFLGGPGTSGVLVVKKDVCTDLSPMQFGGGIVRFVDEKHIDYSDNMFVRQSAGSPNSLAIIKTGLVFLHHQELMPYIMKKNKRLLQFCIDWLKYMDAYKDFERVSLLPNLGDYIPIIAFNIKGYHYNLVVALLNDLFGIQSRGGINCCSLFAQSITKYHKDIERSKLREHILSDKGVPKDYGWVRISLNYTMSNYVVNYITDSIEYLVNNIHKFAKDYVYDTTSNTWRHKSIPKIIQCTTFDELEIERVYYNKDILENQFSQCSI